MNPCIQTLLFYPGNRENLTGKYKNKTVTQRAFKNEDPLFTPQLESMCDNY